MDEQKYCVNCGARMRANARFCDNCGSKVPNNLNAVTAPADISETTIDRKPVKRKGSKIALFIILPAAVVVVVVLALIVQNAIGGKADSLTGIWRMETGNHGDYIWFFQGSDDKEYTYQDNKIRQVQVYKGSFLAPFLDDKLTALYDWASIDGSESSYTIEKGGHITLNYTYRPNPQTEFDKEMAAAGAAMEPLGREFAGEYTITRENNKEKLTLTLVGETYVFYKEEPGQSTASSSAYGH